MNQWRYFLFSKPKLFDESRFYPRLESFRGIAAVIVAIYHSFMIFKFGDHSFGRYFSKIVITFFHGSASVVLFFVLSGFVLGLSLNKKGAFNLQAYIQFILRRLIRIWSTFVISIILTCLYLLFFYNYKVTPYTTGWFFKKYQFQLTYKMILENITFLNTQLNSNSWSLKLEIIGSFCMPFLYCYAVRSRRFFDLLLIVMLTAIGKYCSQSILFAVNMFYMGLIIHKWQPLFNAVSQHRTSFFFLFFICINGLLNFGKVMAWQNSLILGGLAFLIVGIIANSTQNEFKWLDNKVIIYLGKISYSLYLIQFLMMTLTVNLLYRVIPIGLIQQHLLTATIVVTLVHLSISIVGAHCLHYWVEIPCMELFKKKKLSLRCLEAISNSKSSIELPAFNAISEDTSNAG